jgi:hypothetical protein
MRVCMSICACSFFVMFVLLSFDLNVLVPFHLNVFLCWEEWGVGCYTLLYQYLSVWIFFPMLGRSGVGCLSMHLAPIYACMEIFK